MTELNVNNRQLRAEVDGDTPLLWVLREELQLTGTSTAAASRSAAPARCTWTAWRCARA